MIIKFTDMVQINQKTKFLRRIRISIEVKNGNGFFVYEYQQPNQKWLVYNAEIMVQIARAIENDQSLLSINSREIDLDKLIETDSETNVSRKIHRLKSSLFESTLICRYLFISSGEITT
jgi:hypothetical protein